MYTRSMRERTQEKYQRKKEKRRKKKKKRRALTAETWRPEEGVPRGHIIVLHRTSTSLIISLFMK